MESYEVVIIGGGPAGLFAATQLHGIRTLLLEKMQTPGKKLLISGSGQCNVTHAGTPAELSVHFGDHASFIKPALLAFTSTDTLAFLQKNGVACETTPENKVFPASRKADDILQALLKSATDTGTKIQTNTAVKSIKQNNGRFLIETNTTLIETETIILACGGASYPSTGSNGDGAKLAEMLGHTIVPLKESLTPVYVANFAFKELSGISLPDTELRIIRNNKIIARNTGDLLIARFGLSGPVILDASRWMEEGDTLELSFAGHRYEELDALLIDRFGKDGSKDISNLLYGLNIPDRLIHALLEEAGITDSVKGSQVPAAIRKNLVKSITAYRIPVDRLGGFTIAMATAGGVDLSEINKKTCESKLVPNLYFAGEIMDIDGDTGGYNIQAAFSTAYLATKAISARYSARNDIIR
ncbi:MAG TPA: NAD(P)/FAD-dependent oxidoreductase [Methanocorpusculum sp.]|nr:NAD(P)/FAD-dependent oxidoreductase [Methanocorpusculum sp.]